MEPVKPMGQESSHRKELQISFLDEWRVFWGHVKPQDLWLYESSCSEKNHCICSRAAAERRLRNVSGRSCGPTSWQLISWKSAPIVIGVLMYVCGVLLCFSNGFTQTQQLSYEPRARIVWQLGRLGCWKSIWRFQIRPVLGRSVCVKSLCKPTMLHVLPVLSCLCFLLVSRHGVASLVSASGFPASCFWCQSLRGLNSEAPRLLPVCDVNAMLGLCQSCLRAMPPLP